MTVLLLLGLHANTVRAATIDGIKGDSYVIGTECVNGIVSGTSEYLPIGAEQTLYGGLGGLTILKRSGSGKWSESDKIRFWDPEGRVTPFGTDQNINNYQLNGNFEEAQFRGEKNPVASQGVYEMRYIYGSTYTVLGRLYTVAKMGGYPPTFSCVGNDPTPEDQTPDAPTITDLVPGNQFLTATYVAGQAHTYPIAKYQYKLDVVGGSAGTWTDITGTMPTLQQAAILQLTGLVNGTQYAITVRAIDSQDGEGDPSNTVTDTPRIVCSDEVFPAVGSGAAASFECTHNDVTYEFSDFHILTTTSSANQCASLPQETDRTALFCKQDDTSLIAAFDWWNKSKAQLSWLEEVQQVGSRRVEKGGAPCASGSTTVSGRCRNQLYLGEFAFAGMAGVGGAGIQNLDTSNVSVAWHMFDGASDFNQPLSAATWDLSNNFYTAKMFRNAVSFNQDISWFDTRNVSDATYMFAGATAFNNGCAAGVITCPMNWADTSKFDSVNSMFLDAVTFNQDISGWNTGKVTNAEDMFKGAITFNRDISNWNVSKLVLANNMFQGAHAFNQDISSWTVSSIKNATAMFMDARAFNQPLGGWTLSSAQVLSSMFRGAHAFNKDIKSWSTGQVQMMDSMFRDATSFDQDLSGWSVAALRSKTDFDTGASAWCGLGFTNRGRPFGFNPSAGEGCALHVDMEAPVTALAGDKISYVLTYYNESSNAISNGNLSLQLPDQASFAKASEGGVFASDTRKVSWTSVDIPAGSSGSLGGEGVSATVEILSTIPDESDISAIATLSDGASLSAKVTSVTKVTAKSDLSARLTAPPFAVAGQEISYELQVTNRGQVATQSGSVELTWQDSDIKPVSGGQNCSGTPLKCTWGPMVIPGRGEPWTDIVKVVLPADAEVGQIVSAAMVATANNATDNSDSRDSADTEINAKPEIRSTLSAIPASVVKPGDTLVASVTVKNNGTGEAKETNVALPIPTGAVAAIPAGATCDQNLDPCTSYLSWPLGTLAAAEQRQVSATLTAPNTENSSLSLQAQISFKDSQDIADQQNSNTVTLQVATKPVIDLAAQFSPDRFEPGGEANLQFDFANVGTTDATSGKLTFRTPDETSLKTWPQNTLCGGGQCSQGFTGVVSLMLGTVAKSGEASDSGSAVFGLAIAQSADSLGGLGRVAPTTALEFQRKVATATAIPKKVDQEIDGHLIEIIPPGGSSCSLDYVGSEPAYNYPGWTLILDQLLSFTIVECEPGVTVGIRITAGDSLPQDSVATKTSGGAKDSLRKIPGSTIQGQVIEYQLRDNDGDLDLDPVAGELEDPLTVALLGGSGIYVPFVPIPLPFWLLGVLTGLLSYMGYRRLRLSRDAF